MWLINSSIGRKVVMSVTGVALILFLTFHMSMNIVALFSGEAYNTICELLGANWYAVVATIALAALTVCHIVYAFILTAQNRRARGNERYAVISKHVGFRTHRGFGYDSSFVQFLVQYDVCRNLSHCRSVRQSC